MPDRFWTPTRIRLTLVLLLSLGVHWLLLEGATWSFSGREDQPERLEATLVPLPDKKPEPTPVPPPKPKPRPKPHPVAKQAPEARTLPDPTESPVVTAPDSAVVIGSGDAAQSSATGSGASPPADATASEPSTPPTPAAPPAQAPQSAILYYDVLGKDPKRDANQSYVGNGTLTWKLEGVDRYQADLKATASLLFLSFTVLESHSEGALDQGGLEPTRYSETPRNRAALVTLFRRGQDSVGVEPGTITPAQPGTQDRLSIVFQLGALLRGNPGFSEAGASFQVDVANLKGDSSPWTFRVLGLEPVNSGIGRIDAVHVQRVLRPGTNDRRIDVWIALDLGGYPARILYTEPSEAFVDLTLTKIE